jgi:hypothetical protein
MRYTDQERDEILRTACQTVERGRREDRHDPPVEEPAEPEPLKLPPFEDRVAKWKREADEREARFEQERARDRRDERREQQRRARTNSQSWEQWIDARIAAALIDEREGVTRGVIKAVVERIYADLDTDLKTLQATLEKSLHELRATIQAERGTVIDLPNIMRRAN